MENNLTYNLTSSDYTVTPIDVVDFTMKVHLAYEIWGNFTFNVTLVKLIDFL